MDAHLISEPIKPVVSSMRPSWIARGEPDMPREFSWRGQVYTVAEVLDRWKETGPCTSGSDEQYVRKHWFRVRTTDGTEMSIYFERHAASRRERTRRWWLFSLTEKET